MKLSVIIICCNSLGNLKSLLESLVPAIEGIQSEIIITDNGSTDGTQEFIAGNYPSINYLRLNSNRGVAYARNRAIERAVGEYIWILDDDTLVNAPAIHSLLDYMNEHADCGIAACALHSADGARQLSYKPFPGPILKLRNVLGIGSKDPYAELVAAGEPFEPVYVIGACQLIRRALINGIGMLDEAIFYGPEDADFCLRARRAGWHIAYLPQTSIIHHWQRITTRRPFSKTGRAHMRGLLHFYLRHLPLRR